MFVVSLVSWYMEQPTELHLQVVKRVLRYLKGTSDFGIFYKKGGSDDLVAYADSDYAGDLEDRKSTPGYVFLISSGAVSWSSKKQTYCYSFNNWSKVYGCCILCQSSCLDEEDHGKTWSLPQWQYCHVLWQLMWPLKLLFF